jgi:hypothetical protein
MEIEGKKVTRKGNTPIKVYCLPEEREAIEANAKKAGVSVARYLREVGMGYEVKGIMDYKAVLELVKVNADMARLGGLLKMWLADDKRVAKFNKSTIETLLKKIDGTREEMKNIMETVMAPGKSRTRKKIKR